MKILQTFRAEDVATVYLGVTSSGREVEFVESRQPPFSREDKHVLVISCMVGCPVGCSMCDAGTFFGGNLSVQDALEQVDWMVAEHYPRGDVTTSKLKVQFTKMGEPALNAAVLEVLEALATRPYAHKLWPSISTVAPARREPFFERLLAVKERHFVGRFQLQFSLHDTDERRRQELIPTRLWSFAQIAAYGRRFLSPGDRKITLNFALASLDALEPAALAASFDPEHFLVKLTPLNPTYRAQETGLSHPQDEVRAEGPELGRLVLELRQRGFEVIVAIGAPIENEIGSNCGQFVRRHLGLSAPPLPEGYTRVARAAAP